jgi:hypothetical protein
VQLSTFNSDENFNDEDDGVWSNGSQDGECRLLVSQLPLCFVLWVPVQAVRVLKILFPPGNTLLGGFLLP